MNGLTRYTPSRELGLLRREMDRLFNDFLPTGRSGEDASTVWTPRADLAETEDAFVLHFDLPGVPAEHVEVTMEDDTLTISGERRASSEQGEGRWHRIERSYGRFFRTVQFGMPVDPEQVEATFEDGVLTVRIAKAAASKPRRISVQGRARADQPHTEGDGHAAGQTRVEVNEGS